LSAGWRPAWLGGLLLLLGCAPPPAAVTAPSRTSRTVSVERSADGRWQLLRDGQPYVLRGAGAHTRLPLLASSGATSFRTWGVGPDTAARLDEAERLGLTVSLGIWLGHVRHGFDWHDDAQLAEQREAVREAVLAYRDHPALLLWGVGNEMELRNDDPAMWREVGELVRMVRDLDPHHPAMVVTAELGEGNRNAERLRTFVPDLQIWGINSYGGAPSIPERLDAAGYDGPFVITEVGNRGDWESPRTDWGTPLEQTSTEKSQAYRDALAAVAEDPRHLGTYAFLWARGPTPAETWYALLGPGDIRFEPVDALIEAWTGAPPDDRAPSIATLDAPFANARVAPGAALEARLSAEDPEGEALGYAWILSRDAEVAWDAPSPGVDTCRETTDATFTGTAPTTPGPWRLLGVAVDPAGHAAYASARFYVEGRLPRGPALPFWVDGPFGPSGWMGDANARVTMDECPPRPGFCQGPCRRFTYRGGEGEEGWAAIAWMHPQGNWQGQREGVRVPPGGGVVELVAWGAEGGETVTFSVGNYEVDGFGRSLRDVVLSADPTTYRMELDAAVGNDVVFGLTWAATDPGDDAEMVFHVADARWIAE
jgi:hypothetical protein